MSKIKVKIVNRSNHKLPDYSTIMSAGMDIRANLGGPIILKPLQRALVRTGLHIELPAGYEAQIRPRSGLALRNGITSLNSPGTIDADYRGEIKIILINLGEEPFSVKRGDRIAQMVVREVFQGEWRTVDELPETDRNDGGFGHTGK